METIIPCRGCGEKDAKIAGYCEECAETTIIDLERRARYSEKLERAFCEWSREFAEATQHVQNAMKRLVDKVRWAEDENKIRGRNL